ncbi:MAG TPA: hypothetical protein VGQ38_01210 [Gaiellaceae bacterium]|jgi:hypothetical protein|nr:hypothetical protein [Gaiellaceae bacterium]
MSTTRIDAATGNLLAHGTVLAHPGGNPARPAAASRGAFIDPSPFGAHNARVYCFPVG